MFYTKIILYILYIHIYAYRSHMARTMCKMLFLTGNFQFGLLWERQILNGLEQNCTVMKVWSLCFPPIPNWQDARLFTRSRHHKMWPTLDQNRGLTGSTPLIRLPIGTNVKIGNFAPPQHTNYITGGTKHIKYVTYGLLQISWCNEKIGVMHEKLQ